jgi:two-component system OmpR family response regulator
MAKTIKKIFLVDDDPTHTEMLKAFLSEKFNLEIITFSTGEEALKNIELKPSFMILDYNLDRFDNNAVDGVEVLKRFKEADPSINILMLSGQDKIDVAVDSMKYGAFDYVVKNPTGFLRVENAINNINNAVRDKEQLKTYKISTYILIAFIIAVFSLAIILKQLGIATDNLFWV